MSAQDLRFCAVGHHDVRQDDAGFWRCVRCDNVFPMGKPATFSANGLTGNTFNPRPGILPDAQ